MHKRKYITYVLLIVMFARVLIASGNELQKNGFSISIPDGWVEIPLDVIDAYEKEVARLMPNTQIQHIDYAFQLDSSKDWFEYPYIAVIINNTGRIPENQLENFEEYPVQDRLGYLEKGLSSIMSDIQAGKIVYDKQTKMIWMRINLNETDIGPVSSISSMIPTERGFIQVTGYSLREDYPTYEAIFQLVALSVSPEPGLAYKPKWSDSLPLTVTGIDWGKGIAFGILILIGFLFKVLFEKLNINIKHPVFFSLVLWCIGVGIGYLGWIVYEEHGSSFLSYFLFVMGAIPLVIGASVGFYTIFNPPPSKKQLKASKTENFVTSITVLILKKLFRHNK